MAFDLVAGYASTVEERMPLRACLCACALCFCARAATFALDPSHWQGDLTILDSVIRGNRAEQSSAGGGLNFRGGYGSPPGATSRIERTVFEENVANYGAGGIGGALQLDGAGPDTILIRDSIIRRNRAAKGAGILVDAVRCSTTEQHTVGQSAPCYCLPLPFRPTHTTDGSR